MCGRWSTTAPRQRSSFRITQVGVTRADRYEPELQRSYEELAAHYRQWSSSATVPAQGKSRAELTVLLACRWILARLRHQRFLAWKS